MKKFIYILSIVAVFGFISCEKEEIDPGMAPNNELAGAWTIRYYDTDMVDQGYSWNVYTYNTSMDEDLIWMDNIYDEHVKVKAQVLSNTTFGVANGADINEGDYESVTISEAQVIGDSIVYRITLYNPDGSIYDDYYGAGHRTTGEGNDTHN